MTEDQIKLSPKDFKSDQEIRWCAGCGDSAVLNAIQKTYCLRNKHGTIRSLPPNPIPTIRILPNKQSTRLTFHFG